jgi:DMSO/TMAO reductase YedYZ molybdopterin-dependent catalytic subunit
MQTELYGSKKLGAVLGLLATAAGLCVAELIVGLVRGASSPVVPIGQEFIDWTPKWLKDWAIEQFGTNDKVVLVAGALIVVLGLGAVVGILMWRGERARAVMIRPDPTLGKMLPTIVGSVVSIAVLWWLGPKPEVSEVDGRKVIMGVDRRQFINGALTVGSVAAVTGGVGRALQRRFEVGQDQLAVTESLQTNGNLSTAADLVSSEFELGVDGIESFVVPNNNFYRIDTALVVPQVPVDSWKLRIDGMVDNPIELTFEDLLAREQIERYITLSCVSNPVGGGLVGNALWRGVRLKDILEEAGVQDGAEQVVSQSIDGWTCGSPLETIMDGRDAMLAIAMNGEALPAQHGFPVRIVVPGLFGYVSATKWVTEIRLTRWDEFDAYWIPRGWSKEGPVKTMARIDTGRKVNKSDGAVAIGGVAWAVYRGISQVQVRFDEGEWLNAELAGVPSNDTWVQWVYRTVDLAPGRYTVEARALDGDGVPQPEERAEVAPNGAQGYHRITLTVEA